jgi:UDP-N-acetylglucosamine--N-acetylmuramyl-(pentapeptide) pyrophosphoryl-undecaprenol N-acetylglucosamine transferase
MRADPPAALLAMGSYASVGPVLAARSLRLPVVLHEANAVPGRAVSMLAGFADVVAVAFSDAARRIRHARVVFTGLPLGLRDGASFDPGLLRPDTFTLLVMGGSQGAHAINETACNAVCSLAGKGVEVQVIHLAGRRDVGVVRSAYATADVPGVATDFLQCMAPAYEAADMAVSRSGAGACSELAAFGVPALLVPFPSARRDHQTANARILVRGGGADMIAQENLSADGLEDHIDRLRRSPAKLDKMSAAMKAMAVPDADVRLADLIEQVVAGSFPDE